jgi:hypothetical protein
MTVQLSPTNSGDVAFRVIEPRRRPTAQRFYERLSDDTIHLCFFGSIQELSKENAQYFAHLDGEAHFTCVALDPEDPRETITVVQLRL